MEQGSVTKQRTTNYIAQLKGSFIFKIVAVGAAYLAIPIMIQYLGQEKFGIWSTLLSIVSWMVFFDLGIGNGLRNKVAESLAKKDKIAAANYISSGYTLIGLVSFGLFILIAIASFFIPWQSIFNTDAVSGKELRCIILFTEFVITFNFWISLINQVINALQKTSIIVFGQAISSILALLIVYILSVTTKSSLFYLALGYGFSLIATNLLLSVWFYQKHIDYRPKLLLERKHIRPLLSLGGRFFIIQLAVLVIFTTDKILITQLFGPSHVTQYDVVFKLFSFITLVYGLISAPLWSAYTDAYHRGDINWIKKTLYKQLIIFGVIIIATGMLIMMAKIIIKVWLGDDFLVSMSLVISMGVFVIISVWNNVFAYPLNGFGKLNIQTFTALFGMITNIPMSFFLVRHYGFNIDGVVWGTIFALLPFALLSPIQIILILKGKNKNNAFS
jgi:O-antigen/teichoic acid export membrane protein